MNEKKTDTSVNRPFFLSILCISLFVYTGVLSLIFLLSILFNKWISNTLSDFFPEKQIEDSNILMICMVAFVLCATSFISTFLMWKLKRTGLYLFAISSLLFLFFPFIFGFGNYYSLAILGVIIVLLFLYYRRFK